MAGDERELGAKRMRVLAGDVGGTNARLALVDVTGGALRVVERRTVPSTEYPGLAAIVHEFLAQVGARVDRACFGLACPVVDGICAPTNLPWRIDLGLLSQQLGIRRATIINDFHAVGAGLPFLEHGDTEVLHEGDAQPHGPRALIGAGTGLGQGFLTWSGTSFLVHASEGGHVDFSPVSPLQWRLREALAREHGRVSVERVVSGHGLLAIYRFLLDERGGDAPATSAEVLAEGPEAVTRHALAGTDPVAVEALDLFVDAYAGAAGNLALTVLATGGVYVAGGIAPNILPKLRDGAFVQAFLAKGRLRRALERMPVSVITSDDVAILGAASVAAA